jgi:ubiquinone/menaquinone biosynthesis C-methylase UbiE
MTGIVHASAGVKQADARSYDATAAEFARLTERFSRKIAERMLDLARVKPDDRLLDLGTGTGLLARMAAARGANAVGIDHSAGMLEQAQAAAEKDGVGGRTEFLAMDAEALRFDDEAFDVTVSLFVLRHLPNPLVAAREMYRTLKVGGRLVASIGARPNPLQPGNLPTVLGAAMDRIAAARGRRLLSPASLRDFLRRQGLHLTDDHAAHGHLGKVDRMLSTAGFKEIRQQWRGDRYSLTPEDFWHVQSVFDSDARSTLTQCGDAAQSELKERYIELCNEHVRAGHELIYRTGALIFTALR